MVDVVVKKTSQLYGEIFAPPSKSYTQRMVIAAALSQGVSKVWQPLFAQDTKAALRAVSAFGAKVQFDKDCWIIHGAKRLKAPEGPVDCGESGATLRFIVPIATLAEGPSTLLFRGSIERRPVEPLIGALEALGANVCVGKYDNLDAVFVEGLGLAGGKTAIAGDISSQFISGLMFACPLAGLETEIALTSRLESTDYIKMTKTVLSNHAITVNLNPTSITVPGNQTYKPTETKVPGDFSSAAFLLAASAIVRSHITINNLDHEMIQGDRAIIVVLQKMGVKIKVCPLGVEIQSTGNPLIPIDVDVKDIPDLVPVIAVLACYAKGTSHILGAKRLRFKESDRLQSIYAELNKMGAEIVLTEEGLSITGAPLQGAVINTHNDHRIAMAASVAALHAEGKTTIQDAECIRKSYPQFYIHLKQIGADIIGGEFDR